MNTFDVQIDNINKNQWDDLLLRFDDASIYQTWSFGIFSGNDAVSHIILKADGKPVACCQILIKTLPISRIGVARIKWGPLCLPKNTGMNYDALHNIILVIKNEYAIKRGYLVCIEPIATDENKQYFKQILDELGFELNVSYRPYQTFIVDLSKPTGELRNNLSQQWRRGLNKAQKQDLHIIQSTNIDLYRVFLRLSKEMYDRKHVVVSVNYRQYMHIQEDLPTNLKMTILVCTAQNEPVNALVTSSVGNTGIFMFAASATKGLTYNGSYLLQWRMIELLKESGKHYYDLGGIDHEQNPGGYQFKKGIAGKNCQKEELIGEYYGVFTNSAKLSLIGLSFMRIVKTQIKKLRTFF